jgi:hypothetical protein
VIGVLRSLAFLLVLGALSAGCVRPAPIGLSRVAVCVTYETGARYDGPPRATKGASVCADFEPAPAAEPE